MSRVDNGKDTDICYGYSCQRDRDSQPDSRIAPAVRTSAEKVVVEQQRDEKAGYRKCLGDDCKQQVRETEREYQSDDNSIKYLEAGQPQGLVEYHIGRC